ncbi:VOC family protein [Deinococcus sp.]|uniref:VOC family protein n=1 Tax=Deinococcus sp. TaxID=47478 RepID=UPI003CC5FB9B
MIFKQLHHFALVVADLDSSVNWYQSVLDFKVERRFGFSDAGVQIAHLISDTGIRVELIEQEGSGQSPDLEKGVFEALKTQGVKHVGLLVADIDSAFLELNVKGAEIASVITRVEPAGVKNFWIKDNSGNLIEINQWL